MGIDERGEGIVNEGGSVGMDGVVSGGGGDGGV